MIEQETTIMMRCDKCGGVLIDDYGHIIKVDGFDDDRVIEIGNIIKDKWFCFKKYTQE